METSARGQEAGGGRREASKSRSTNAGAAAASTHTGGAVRAVALALALPNDGTAPRTPYPRAGVIDLNPANVTVCRSQYWLIDASGL